MADRWNPLWSVVVRKEPRSGRNEDDVEEGVIGAAGYEERVTTNDGMGDTHNTSRRDD